jgi:hypothetical protein
MWLDSLENNWWSRWFDERSSVSSRRDAETVRGWVSIMVQAYPTSRKRPFVHRIWSSPPRAMAVRPALLIYPNAAHICIGSDTNSKESDGVESIWLGWWFMSGIDEFRGIFINFVARLSPIWSPINAKGVVKTALKSKRGEYSAYEDLLLMLFGKLDWKRSWKRSVSFAAVERWNVCSYIYTVCRQSVPKF